MGRTIARSLALVVLVIRSGADLIGTRTKAALRHITCESGGVPSRCQP